MPLSPCSLMARIKVKLKFGVKWKGISPGVFILLLSRKVVLPGSSLWSDTQYADVRSSRLG